MSWEDASDFHSTMPKSRIYKLKYRHGMGEYPKLHKTERFPVIKP
jgi:hypothetical protein